MERYKEMTMKCTRQQLYEIRNKEPEICIVMVNQFPPRANCALFMRECECRVKEEGGGGGGGGGVV